MTTPTLPETHEGQIKLPATFVVKISIHQNDEGAYFFRGVAESQGKNKGWESPPFRTDAEAGEAWSMLACVMNQTIISGVLSPEARPLFESDGEGKLKLVRRPII